jgi:DNA-binding Lrp family transcriptional regulator
MPKTLLDRIDYRILHFIQNDARMTNAELAERVGLSPSPCLRRVKSLESAGIIKRYVGIVGGFNRSSQHLDKEELRWKQTSVENPIVLGGLRCRPPVARR